VTGAGGGPPESIQVAAAVIEAILEHARREAPRECCGLLVGDRFRIDESVPAANIAVEPSRFLIDPADHIALNRRLRGSGRDVVGAYHSHPNNSPVPSPRDIADAHYPEFLHIIVSLIGNPEMRVRGYRIRPAGVTEVALRTAAAG
jgi:proteasome lid subunit RPN8/RPN11